MRDRLAAESAEDREARLRDLTVLKHERLATESTEEREARLCDLSARQLTQKSKERQELIIKRLG